MRTDPLRGRISVRKYRPSLVFARTTGFTQRAHTRESSHAASSSSHPRSYAWFACAVRRDARPIFFRAVDTDLRGFVPAVTLAVYPAGLWLAKTPIKKPDQICDWGRLGFNDREVDVLLLLLLLNPRPNRTRPCFPYYIVSTFRL